MKGWFVSYENRIGQVTWTCYESKENFEKFYAGRMKDGSNDLIKDVYLIIHYSGSDMEECQRINNEKSEESYRNPATPLIHAIASLGYMDAAEDIRKKTKE